MLSLPVAGTMSALAPKTSALMMLTGPAIDPRDDTGTGPALLADVVDRGEGGWLRIYRPAPTVAFSRRDTLHAGFGAAVEISRDHGFMPVVRAPGGRAAAYHERALCLELVVADPDARTGTTARFVELADLIALALTSLGVDARVGAVPDEYCPGRYSVNGAGRVKLAGTAQRIVRGGWFIGAVILVDGAAPVREVIAPVYQTLGMHCDVTTVGSVADLTAGIDVHDVSAALITALDRRLPLQSAHYPTDLVRRARLAAPSHPILTRPAEGDA